MSNFSFKPEDWVILKKHFIKKYEKQNVRNIHEMLDMCRYPRKVQAIYLNEFWPYRERIEFSRYELWTIYEDEFRLATDKEIKEQHIRDIFHKK